jgi:probable phosphoglycerate mutase
MILYVIRHGDPDYANDCLTPKGKRQAEALAKRFAARGLDRVYSSPLGRAKQTARPTCELLKLESETLEWTSENLAWEDFSAPLPDGGRAWSFRTGNPALFRLAENGRRADWHGLENFKGANAKAGFERLSRRSDEFLAALGYAREGGAYKIVRPNDERVAVFCHEGFGLTWLAHLLAVPPHVFWASFGFTHSAVTALLFENRADGITAPQCLCHSDTSHVYREGLPATFNNEFYF